MDQQPLMRMVHCAHREWTNYMKKMALEAGIPESYRLIIMYLAHHPGASQKDLSEFTQKTYAAVSQTIKEMQLAGYLTKSVKTDDQRYAQLCLTEKGMESAGRIRDKINEADRVITSVLTPEKEAEMVRWLERICETIRKGMDIC